MIGRLVIRAEAELDIQLLVAHARSSLDIPVATRLLFMQ